MLAVISPAKTLDYKRALPPIGSTAPRFEEEAGALAAHAARLSRKKLAELMHISPALADLNAERFRTFEARPKRPAIFAFAGDVYTGFEAHSLDREAILFAQEHLRILSGLYGLLRPLDEIRPYRLEMGTRWAPGRKADLYGHWGRASPRPWSRTSTLPEKRSSSTWRARNIGRRPSGIFPRERE